MHTLGRPPRRLTLLHLDGSENRLPAAGADLLLGEKSVGFVGSSARHHELGPIALALVKRNVDLGAELLDPVRSQYKEAFVVVRCTHGGETYSRCVYIWVDKDFALARGWYQGYPKKLGSIWMTRPVSVGRAGPRLAAGGVFGATLQANDRRLADARLTLTGPSETAGFVNALPMLHSRWMPSIEKDGGDALAELVTMRSRDVELGPAYTGEAEIHLFEAPEEELAALEPQEMIGGYWRQVGATFDGGTRLA